MNSALEYNRLYKDVLTYLEKIEKLNIDISSYKILVEDINKETLNNSNNIIKNRNISTSDRMNVLITFGSDNNYNEAIYKLNKIYDILKDEYNSYLIIEHTCNYIEALEVFDYNDGDNRIINALSELSKINYLNYNDIEKIINRLFKNIYKVLKNDLLNNNYNLFDYLNNHELYKSYIVKYIEKDINNINDNLLKIRLEEIKCNGDDLLIYDKKLISGIVFIENKDILISNIINTLESNIEKYNSNLESINKLQAKRNKKKNNYYQKKKSIDDNLSKKRLVFWGSTSAIALILSLGLVILPKKFKYPTYKTTTMTYTEDRNNKKKDSFEREYDHNIEIFDISKWQDVYSKGYKNTKVVSELDLNLDDYNIDELFLLDILNNKDTYSYYEYLNNFNKTDDYNDERIVKVINQDLTNSKNEYGIPLVLFDVMVLFVFLLSDIILISVNYNYDDKSFYGLIRMYIDLLIEYLSNIKEKCDILDEVTSKLKEIDLEINKTNIDNDVIKKNINDIYNKFKELGLEDREVEKVYSKVRSRGKNE